jgi:hypothetical protein
MRYILWKDENQADAAKLLDFLTAGLAPEKG